MVSQLNTARPARTQTPRYEDRFVVLTAAYTVNYDNDDGKVFVLDNATGFAVTLPPALGKGFKCRFIFKTTVTSGSQTIVAAGSDKMNGFAHLTGAAAADLGGFNTTAGTATTITMDGSTRGGFAGDVVEVEDLILAVWHARIYGHATSTVATPFS